MRYFSLSLSARANVTLSVFSSVLQMVIETSCKMNFNKTENFKTEKYEKNEKWYWIAAGLHMKH